MAIIRRMVLDKRMNPPITRENIKREEIVTGVSRIVKIEKCSILSIA